MIHNWGGQIDTHKDAAPFNSQVEDGFQQLWYVVQTVFPKIHSSSQLLEIQE